MPKVELRSQPVELYKLLKFEGLVASGGEAKALIAEGHVKLNGSLETRKRKKIAAGDIVEFKGERYEVFFADGLADKACSNKARSNEDGVDGESAKGVKSGSGIDSGIDVNVSKKK